MSTNSIQSIKYEVVIGIPEDEFVHGRLESNIDKIYESWKKYAKEFFDNNDIYVSAIAIPGKALYHSHWGCPKGGERVISFNCTANPEFIKDYDKYEEGVLYITKKLKKEFQQHTITITKIPSSVFYLTDENTEEE